MADKRIEIRVSEEEYAAIDNMATVAGMTRSAWIRARLIPDTTPMDRIGDDERRFSAIWVPGDVGPALYPIEGGGRETDSHWHRDGNYHWSGRFDASEQTIMANMMAWCVFRRKAEDVDRKRAVMWSAIINDSPICSNDFSDEMFMGFRTIAKYIISEGPFYVTEWDKICSRTGVDISLIVFNSWLTRTLTQKNGLFDLSYPWSIMDL